MDESLGTIIRNAEENLRTGTVKTSQYVEHNLYDVLSTIDAYLNSIHTSGATDSLNREKPFFNIVTAASNIWYRATDLDTRGIKFQPPSLKKVIQTYAAHALLQDWMRKNNFGAFLNQWGLTLARYGSAVVKFIEVEGELKPSVIPWNRLIVDPIDFYALPRIERLYKTPAQLLNMSTPSHPDYAGYDYDMAQDLIDALTSRKTTDGQQKDNMSEFIELYEVHGELSLATYNEAKGLDVRDEDKERFFQQMHVLSFTKGKDGKYKEFTLYSGKEKQDPYMITHLLEEDGRTLGKGAVEYLFDAQWMVNHTMKQMKDYLDLSSKILFQTADPNFLGRNVLSSIETGQIFIHSPNNPLTQVSNTAQNAGAMMNYANQWVVGAQNASATPDSVRGNASASVTSGVQLQSLQEQALSLFDMLTENKKLYLNQMIRTFVLPNLIKKMDTVGEVSAILSQDDVKLVDASFIPEEAVRKFNRDSVDKIIQGRENELMPFEEGIAQANVTQSLAPLGNRRSFKPTDIDEGKWSESLKGFEWEIVIEDGESANKRELFATLFSFIQAVKQNPLVAQEMAQAQIPQAPQLPNQQMMQNG